MFSTLNIILIFFFISKIESIDQVIFKKYKTSKIENPSIDRTSFFFRFKWILNRWKNSIFIFYVIRKRKKKLRYSVYFINSIIITSVTRYKEQTTDVQKDEDDYI